MSTVTAADIKTLEQTRQRLAQLTSSLNSLQSQIATSDPLPPWLSLHSHLLLLSTTLESLSSVLRANAPLLSSMVAYPLPRYPGREHEALLTQIMRKKLEPGVEDWVNRGLEAGRMGGGAGAGAGAGGGGLGGRSDVEDEDEEEDDDDEDEDVEMEMGEGGGGEVRGWRQLWESAPVVGNEEARKYDWGGGGVGEEEGGSDEDDEEEEEQVVVDRGKERGLGVDGWLRVLSKGEVGR